MALRDHDYVIRANHEVEVVHDHNYDHGMPFVEIGPQQVEEVEIPLEEDEEPVEVDEEPVEVYGEPVEVDGEPVEVDGEPIEVDGKPVEEDSEPIEEDGEPVEEDEEPPIADIVVNEVPQTYTTLPGIRQNSTIYVDNLKYKYYKREFLVNTISLVCERQKNRRHPICFGTASVSRNIMDNRIVLLNPHNHQPSDIDLNVPYLREAISNKGLNRTNTTASVRTIYNNEIIQHAEVARNYTHLQAVRRVAAMRSLERPTIPLDLHELAEILNNPQYSVYPQTVQVPPSRFLQQEVVINGRSVGIVFANRVAIELYGADLNKVTMVGIYETFKNCTKLSK